MAILKGQVPSSDYRFSDHFELNKTQAQLDFVDIPLETDINLFLDPYALHVGKTEWFKEANNLVVDFFDHLLNAIKTGNQIEAVRLLANLHEPNDARLGFCTGLPKGRGIGVKQAKELYDRFRTSRAVNTGSLRDLLDCELMIPGISSDKISDMTVNIIRGLLVTYTQAQCELWNIPTEEVEAGVSWDSEIHAWVNSYAMLPTFKGKGLLLVPKSAVRRRLEANHEDYLNKAVIPFLKAEELTAGSGLVKMIKNGKRVLKKDIEAKYFGDPNVHIKDALHDFTLKHPDVLDKFKQERFEKPRPLSDYELEESHAQGRELSIRRSAEDLQDIAPGTAQAAKYHNAIIGLMTTIFGDSLTNPKKEQPLHSGRKRVDITYNNGALKGFFHDLHTKHRIHCPYVFVECKNYTADPNNPELDQLTGRFSAQRGQLGILVCRTVEDEDLLLRRCKDSMHDSRGFILILTDADFLILARHAARQEHAEISAFMQRKLDALLLN